MLNYPDWTPVLSYVTGGAAGYGCLQRVTGEEQEEIDAQGIFIHNLGQASEEAPNVKKSLRIQVHHLFAVDMLKACSKRMIWLVCLEPEFQHGEVQISV